MDAFIIGALSSFIVTCVYLLFKKSEKKIIIKIQTGILIAIAFLLFCSLLGCFFMMLELPIIAIITMIPTIIGGFFTIRKILRNFKRMKKNDIDEDKKNDIDEDEKND